MPAKKIQKIEVISHVDEVTEEMEKALQRGLVEIGLKAQGYATLKAPVDTGRLQKSINWATATASGNGEDAPKGTPDENSVCIGTNVEYAQTQELGNFKHKVGFSPFLKPAMEENMEEYKKILEEELKGE